jgi:fido (protein-threonine AMPylation protein)
VWQIHPFGEGNTWTTAVFLIKYLRKLGFAKVTNNLIAEHAWYFRNALVRANYEDLSKGIYKTDRYLIRFFEILLQLNRGELKNREMLVQYRSPENDTVNDTVKVALMQYWI